MSYLVFFIQAVKHGQVNYVFPKPKAFTCKYYDIKHIISSLSFKQFILVVAGEINNLGVNIRIFDLPLWMLG